MSLASKPALDARQPSPVPSASGAALGAGDSTREEILEACASSYRAVRLAGVPVCRWPPTALVGAMLAGGLSAHTAISILDCAAWTAKRLGDPADALTRHIQESGEAYTGKGE